MTKKFTLSSKCLLIVCLIIFLSFAAQATKSPKLKFINPVLVSGVGGQINATYKFTNVRTGIDAFITIENIVNGAYLVNIDEPVFGYPDAWQPVVSGPGVPGFSYIKWVIEFKITSGMPYMFDDLDASSIDVDGDNARVREFVKLNGQTSYSIPGNVPTALNIYEELATDNVNGDDLSPANVFAMGPVANRTNIDTLSDDVQIDYHFDNLSKIKLYTGSQVEDNGTSGGALDRFHCIYFNKIAAFSLLPVTYHSFDAVKKNDEVQLKWTIEETTGDDFEIERSFDLKTFKTIAIVMGSQSGLSKAYAFRDKGEELTTNKVAYYRIKSIDKDNIISYSLIKKVVLSSDKIIVQLYPNPFTAMVSLEFSSDAIGTGEISLFNITGNVIKHVQVKIIKGSNKINIEGLNALAPGNYFINLVINGKLAVSQKLVK